MYIAGINEAGCAASRLSIVSGMREKRRVLPHSYVIGIDEVGRGALAGPVVVAAVTVRREERIEKRGKREGLGELRDSKRLTPRQRERWHEYLIRHPQIRFVLARVYPRMIERVNIARAANLAAWRAYRRLADICHLPSASCRIYLDGGLYLKNPYVSRSLGARTIPKGDRNIPAVAMASIIAKVTRDRYMARLAKRYQAYGFEVHKGYGTRKHIEALRKQKPSEMHRLTFLRKRGNMQNAERSI